MYHHIPKPGAIPPICGENLHRLPERYSDVDSGNRDRQIVRRNKPTEQAARVAAAHSRILADVIEADRFAIGAAMLGFECMSSYRYWPAVAGLARLR
jgi:hypothetical protein